MLDFEFFIDTGDAKAVCCRQPTYGVHEAKIMIKHITQLEDNNWIRDCTRPWGALLFLFSKPRQESCVHIDKLVRRLCASYHLLTALLARLNSPFHVVQTVLKIDDIRTGFYSSFLLTVAPVTIKLKGVHVIRKS